MASIHIAIVSKEEYPLFSDISGFPDDYGAFLDLVDKEIKEATNAGIVAIKVNVNFAGFREWCGTRKHATYNDLLRYAAILIKRK